MNTYPLRRKLIDICAAELGVTEIGNSNSGKRVREYQAATNLGGTGWPWCAGLVCWAIREWLKNSDVRDALKLTVKGAEAWRPKCANAFGFEEWGRSKGLLIIDDAGNDVLHTADIMTFDMSHVGIVVDDNQDLRLVYTIEGNTSGSGSRDGGGVWKKTRHRSEARKFVRMLP